jgi:hypothetical protein
MSLNFQLMTGKPKMKLAGEKDAYRDSVGATCPKERQHGRANRR